MAARETLFLDTSYVIALMAPKDFHHSAAQAWVTWLARTRSAVVTHEGILTEIGDGFARPPQRTLGVAVLEQLTTEPLVEIVALDADLRRRALALYRSRLDKDWGLTDCVSIVLMTDRGLTGALTTDQHFVQAGFRALLGEQPPA